MLNSSYSEEERSSKVVLTSDAEDTSWIWTVTTEKGCRKLNTMNLLFDIM